MAGRSVNDILASKQIIGVVSRLRGPATILQDFWGMGIGGSNIDQVSGRQFFYDVFNVTRTIAKGRRPGAATATTPPQKVGEVLGVFPRAAERIPLLDEDLINRRRLGGPLDELDSRGERYITQQEAFLAQRFTNIREFQIAAMMRGSYVYVQSGDDMFHDFTGTGTTIDFQIPAGNKGQLDIVGDGAIITTDWATAGSDIPGNIHMINQQMIQLTGWPLRHVICKSDVWQDVLSNTAIQTQSGSANSAILDIQQDANGSFRGRVRCLPWLTFTVLEGGLDTGTDESYATLIEDDHAFFLPDPSPAIAQYMEGSEIVHEESGAKAERFGMYAYADATYDPSGWELKGIHNGMPALYVPGAICYADLDVP